MMEVYIFALGDQKGVLVSNELRKILDTVYKYSFKYYSVCHETYKVFTHSKKNAIQKLLPNDLQNNLLCAASTVADQGSCKGDSGGPLMSFDWKTRRWILVASVEGQIGPCGNRDYPGIYVRISQEDVFSFIQEYAVESFGGEYE